MDHSMGWTLWFLIPEIILFVGAVVVSVMGLSKGRAFRDAVPLVVCLFLGTAFIITPFLYTEEHLRTAADHGVVLLMPVLGKFVKMTVCIIGIGLAMLSTGLIDRKLEQALEAGRAAFDPLRVNRGEYFAFFLLSLIGVMLICNANDLIWLFLALELTSLPTYIMVAMSRGHRTAQEAAVKYFFLGAMSAALFLYGFALLYGATGTIVLTEMQAAFADQTVNGGISTLGIVGMILSILGISFKIAAAPMHFYTPDVYQGAAAPVTGFLAFVPKAAGMLALILLLGTMGWQGHLAQSDGTPLTGLPAQIVALLWIMAIFTMTLGNIGALLQTSIKRMLAYSSIAHSGYMMIGLLAGGERGINAVLFYLLAYGIMNTAAFAVLAGLERRGVEVDSMEDLAGLRQRHPGMAVVLAIAGGSLLGLPPLLGFIGKLYLFMAGIEAGHLILVVIAAVNSAISGWYYLRLVSLAIFVPPSADAEDVQRTPSMWPRVAGVVAAIAVVFVPLFGQRLLDAADAASVQSARAIESSDEPPVTEELVDGQADPETADRRN